MEGSAEVILVAPCALDDNPADKYCESHTANLCNSHVEQLECISSGHSLIAPN